MGEAPVILSEATVIPSEARDLLFNLFEKQIPRRFTTPLI